MLNRQISQKKAKSEKKLKKSQQEGNIQKFCTLNKSKLNTQSRKRMIEIEMRICTVDVTSDRFA